MSPRRGLVLNRTRDVAALLGDALTVYFQHFPSFFAISAAIVVPAQLIVSGVGLEQLSASYDEDLSVAEILVPTAVSFLIAAPLVTGGCVYALQSVAQGEGPGPGRAIVAALEAFAPLFGAVLIAAAGIALGLFLLILPGIYLAIRWFFVPQAVVLEGDRGPAALTRSAALTQGFWWRTLGLIVLAQLAMLIPTLVLGAPFTSFAESSDRAVWALVGTVVTEIVTAPFIAIYATLLWFDLRARRAEVA